MKPVDSLKQYEKNINNHDFDQLVPLISDKAVFWFNDGSYAGLDKIRYAFEKTWQAFPLESYWLEDVKWLGEGEDASACIYNFRWQATIGGKSDSGGGRGTTVFQKDGGDWKIVHEHLSQFPK